LAHDFAILLREQYIAYNQELQKTVLWSDCFEEIGKIGMIVLKFIMINYNAFNVEDLFVHLLLEDILEILFCDWFKYFKMVNLLDITKKSEPLKKPLAELKQHD
jgi:hypothetical protein